MRARDLARASEMPRAPRRAGGDDTPTRPGHPAPVRPPRPYEPGPGTPVRPPAPYQPTTPNPPVRPPAPYRPPQSPPRPPAPPEEQRADST
ncbi:MAG TPA: hypothetical protein VIG30_16580 [Ktedonobacterales bacterium]